MSSASHLSATATATATAATPMASHARVTPQGGILEGSDPSRWDKNNPFILFIIQAGIIIIFCRLLHLPLSKIRQPRVIAEVIGGILLGPSVMGRIPHFTAHIFPTESMPSLNLVANVGLVLFLFLVGLEVDLRLFASNWKVALSVGAAGMALPFGLGCAIAYGLYHQFRTESGLIPIAFGVYMLFVGVAMAITAFPVLCRILTELKLLHSKVGLVALSAGVGNDVVGWILLALCVALVNAGSGLTALWVLLVCVGYVLVLVYLIRPAFLWVLRRTGSLQNGPTEGVVCLTLLMALASAFFTGVIGVHPIFGGFLIGLICPHDGGFAIQLTEKIEDLVTTIFLPLYFALSGLSTNLGLLNNGITWGYTVGVIAVAFVGKFVGGTLAARFCRLVWRESFTVGVLMSCKGLVELIVLNIGLQAKILSQRTFTMFVVMALITTFATTPLTTLLYPPAYQRKLEAWRRGEIDWDGNRLVPDDRGTDSDGQSIEKLPQREVRRLMVYLRLDNLPGLITFVSLLGPDGAGARKIHPQRAAQRDNISETETVSDEVPQMARRRRPFEVHGVRMIELTDRTSSVMRGSDVGPHAITDPVVNIFRTFGRLNDLRVSGTVSVVPEYSYAETLRNAASDQSSDLLLLSWSAAGSVTEGNASPFYSGLEEHRFSDTAHNQFITDSFNNAVCDVAVFVNRDFGGTLSSDSSLAVSDHTHHVFFPFFGGLDDRAALHFVMQLAQNPNVTATIIYIDYEGSDMTSHVPSTLTNPTSSSPRSEKNHAEAYTSAVPLYTSKATEHDHFNSVQASPLATSLESRTYFDVVTTQRPLNDIISRAKTEVGRSHSNAGDLVVVGRSVARDRGFASYLETLGPSIGRDHHTAESSETRKSLGDVGEAVVNADVKASVVVVQAAPRN